MWAGRNKQSGTECTKQKQLISRKMSLIFWDAENAGAKAMSANFYWPQGKKVKGREHQGQCKGIPLHSFHLVNVLDSYGCCNVFSQTVA